MLVNYIMASDLKNAKALLFPESSFGAIMLYVTSTFYSTLHQLEFLYLTSEDSKDNTKIVSIFAFFLHFLQQCHKENDAYHVGILP